MATQEEQEDQATQDTLEAEAADRAAAEDYEHWLREQEEDRRREDDGSQEDLVPA